MGIIVPLMRERSERKARKSSESVISLRTMLAVTIHWLAGVSYLDLCFARGVGGGLVAPFSAEEGFHGLQLVPLIWLSKWDSLSMTVRG